MVCLYTNAINIRLMTYGYSKIFMYKVIPIYRNIYRDHKSMQKKTVILFIPFSPDKLRYNFIIPAL